MGEAGMLARERPGLVGDGHRVDARDAARVEVVLGEVRPRTVIGGSMGSVPSTSHSPMSAVRRASAVLCSASLMVLGQREAKDLIGRR
jgi:hypothetical protein